MNIAANLSSGVSSLNTPFFNLYTSNVANLETWTQEHVPGSSGICVPETMRYNGNGFYGGGQAASNASCDTTIAPSYNSQTLTSGAEVSLWIWRQYQTTGSTSFLQAGYPFMKASAQFLLSQSTLGSDRFLHTNANSHETQWSVTDPVTDIVAESALFPVVVSAAQTLGTDAPIHKPAAKSRKSDPAAAQNRCRDTLASVDRERGFRGSRRYRLFHRAHSAATQRREPRPRGGVALWPDWR